jgi:type II secretory pathway pseudopilin PulG
LASLPWPALAQAAVKRLLRTHYTLQHHRERIMTRNRLHRSPARRQSGFIQGTILFALAILGVIIAAFAVSNTGSSTNTDTERDRVNAGVILKAGSDLQDAFSRAMGDNWQAPDIELTGATNPATPVLYLYDPLYKYAVQVRLPDQAFENNTAVAFADDNVLGTALGDSSVQERVVTLTGLRANVCRRINNLVTGGPWNANATPPATLAAAASTISGSEGCYGDSTAGYTYYRVVAVDSGT